MLSQKLVRSTINSAEEIFLQCLGFLFQIKTRTIQRQNLLDFQPRLASALLGLDRLRHEASRERRHIASRIHFLSSDWVNHRLSLLDNYKNMLDAAAKRGRLLGDTFVWFFYCREELHLLEHIKHEAVRQIPYGMGGLAEVDFVKQFPIIEDRFLLIYHGVTSFLSVGDVSLIDLTDCRLAALGELKLGPIENGSAKTALTLIGKSDLLQITAASEVAQPWPPFNIKSPERFKRQLDRMENVVTVSSPNDSKHLRLQVDYSCFKEAYSEAISKGAAFRQLSASLAILVTAVRPNPSLFARMKKVQLPSRILERFKELPQRVMSLITPNSDDNALWIGKLSLDYLPSTTPLFWTPIPNEILEGVFKEHIVVTTLYNPARFIHRLRAFGFEVSFMKETPELSICLTQDGQRIEFQNTNFFLSLIQDHFADETKVADSIGEIALYIKEKNFEQPMVIDLKMMQLHPDFETFGPERSQ